MALTAATGAVTCVALPANVIAAPAAAGRAGVPTDAWGGHLVATLAAAWTDTFCALLVWGVVGLTLTLVTRSAAAAISVGAGDVLVLESVVRSAASSVSDYLPGATISALAQGGTPALSYPAALGLGVAYVVVGLGLAATVLTRRDITDEPPISPDEPRRGCRAAPARR